MMTRLLRLVVLAVLCCVVLGGVGGVEDAGALSVTRGVWRQLAGPAEGTQVADFDPTCPPTGPFGTHLRHQYDITVAGGPAVGTVRIALDTCVSIVDMVSHWNGTFALRTRLGDVSGRVSGLVTEVLPLDVRTDFTLIPSSGTNALGNNFVPLKLELIFNSPGPAVIAPATGTLTVGSA